MEQGRKRRLMLYAIICAAIIITTCLVWYSKPFNRIGPGMAESEVIEIMGEPDDMLSQTKYPVSWGPSPDIPNGTEYKSYFYDDGSTWQYIWLVSPEDYDSITGKTVESDEWVVIEKLETEDNIVY